MAAILFIDALITRADARVMGHFSGDRDLFPAMTFIAASEVWRSPVIKAIVRGVTVYTCSKVGARMTCFFEGIGPIDQMMWFGTLGADAEGQERWVMSPSMRQAIGPVLGVDG